MTEPNQPQQGPQSWDELEGVPLVIQILHPDLKQMIGVNIFIPKQLMMVSSALIIPNITEQMTAAFNQNLSNTIQQLTGMWKQLWKEHNSGSTESPTSQRNGAGSILALPTDVGSGKLEPPTAHS